MFFFISDLSKAWDRGGPRLIAVECIFTPPTNEPQVPNDFFATEHPAAVAYEQQKRKRGPISPHRSRIRRG